VEHPFRGLQFEIWSKGEHAWKREARSGVSNRVISGGEPNRRKSKVEEAREMEKLVKEVHSVRGADSQIVERGMNSIIVNMEDKMFPSKIMSPTEDRVQDGVHLLNLDVGLSKPLRGTS
jgi:hypothetical protein